MTIALITAAAALALYLLLCLRGAPTFVPGFGGTMTIGGMTAYMADWDFGFEVKLLQYDTMSKTPSLGYYMENYIAGLATGDVRIKGFWDNTGGQMPSGPTFLIRPGGKPTIVLTYDGTVGYTMTAIIQKINPKSSAGGTADFDFDAKVLSMVSWTGQS